MACFRSRSTPPLPTCESAADAEAMVTRLWAAEKRGPEAVAAVQREMQVVLDQAAELTARHRTIIQGLEGIRDAGPAAFDPAQLDPYLAQMQETGLLTAAQAAELRQLADEAHTDWQAMEEAARTGTFEAYVREQVLRKMAREAGLTWTTMRTDWKALTEDQQAQFGTFEAFVQSKLDAIEQRDEVTTSIGVTYDDPGFAVDDQEMTVRVRYDDVSAHHLSGVRALAKGGLVTRPTLALLGERETEAVMPMSQIGRMGTSVQVHVDARGALFTNEYTSQRELARIVSDVIVSDLEGTRRLGLH